MWPCSGVSGWCSRGEAPPVRRAACRWCLLPADAAAPPGPVRSPEEPREQARGRTQLHTTTLNHTQPHTATHSHTQPHTPTHIHTQPHTPTHSHTKTTLSYTQPHTATHNHTQRPHTATNNHTVHLHPSQNQELWSPTPRVVFGRWRFDVPVPLLLRH